MQQEGFQIVWHHIGGGKELENFQNLISTEGSSNIFFHGDKTNEEVHEFIATNQIDLFINVSESEGLPVSIMEAMSYAIPCIAPEIGGIPEAIQHRKNGFILPKEPAIEEIKNEILNFYNLNYNEKAIMAQQAKATWTEKFDATNNTTLFYTRFLNF
jgi:glycosyltransferase involved in cell wall biosynthesis